LHAKGEQNNPLKAPNEKRRAKEERKIQPFGFPPPQKREVKACNVEQNGHRWEERKRGALTVLQRPHTAVAQPESYHEAEKWGLH